EGALAATVRSEHRDELAHRQIDGEVVIHRSALELLAQPAHGDVRLPRLALLGRRSAFGPGPVGSSDRSHLPHHLLAQLPRSDLARILSFTLIGPAITPSLMKTSTSAWYDFRSVSLRSLKPRR